MSNNWNIDKYLVGGIFLCVIIIFIMVHQYWFVLFTLPLFLVLLKIEELTELACEKLGIKTKFQPSTEKIKEDLKENNEEITEERVEHYKNLEIKVLKKVHKRLGGILKGNWNFIYGSTNKTEFQFQPDATIQTSQGMFFIEIKHVLSQQVASQIIRNGISQLKMILKQFELSSPDAKLHAMLVILSPLKINESDYSLSDKITLVIFKI